MSNQGGPWFWGFLWGAFRGSLIGGMYVTEKITGSIWTPRDAVYRQVTP